MASKRSKRKCATTDADETDLLRIVRSRKVNPEVKLYQAVKVRVSRKSFLMSQILAETTVPSTKEVLFLIKWAPKHQSPPTWISKEGIVDKELLSEWHEDQSLLDHAPPPLEMTISQSQTVVMPGEQKKNSNCDGMHTLFYIFLTGQDLPTRRPTRAVRFMIVLLSFVLAFLKFLAFNQIQHLLHQVQGYLEHLLCHRADKSSPQLKVSAPLHPTV